MTERHHGYVEFCGEVVPIRIRRYGSVLSQRSAASWRWERAQRRAEAERARFTRAMAIFAAAALVASTARILAAL